MCAHYCCSINVNVTEVIGERILVLYIDSKTGRFSIVIWGRHHVEVFTTVGTD